MFAYPQPWVENLTGTRGAYRSYNTAKPKVEAWQPKVVPRGKPLQ
jgi:NADH dehydrogenase (ubiquinone) 1 alpha subcomplex subunit 12